MPPALDHTQYADATDDFKSAANENCWAIFTESRVGFANQYSVWTTALKTAREASLVDQGLVNKLEYLSNKCKEIATESGLGGR